MNISLLIQTNISQISNHCCIDSLLQVPNSYMTLQAWLVGLLNFGVDCPDRGGEVTDCGGDTTDVVAWRFTAASEFWTSCLLTAEPWRKTVFFSCAPALIWLGDEPDFKSFIICCLTPLLTISSSSLANLACKIALSTSSSVSKKQRSIKTITF